MKLRENIWLALVEVEPLNDNNDLEGAKGAFVSVAYKANSKNEFIKIINASFEEHNFKVLEIDEVERADHFEADVPDHATKLLLLKEVESGNDYAWGEFYTYEEE